MKAITALLELQQVIMGATRETKQELTAISTPICWKAVGDETQECEKPTFKRRKRLMQMYARHTARIIANSLCLRLAGLVGGPDSTHTTMPQRHNYYYLQASTITCYGNCKEETASVEVAFQMIDLISPGGMCPHCPHLIWKESERQPQGPCPWLLQNARPKQEHRPPAPSCHHCRICISR